MDVLPGNAPVDPGAAGHGAHLRTRALSAAILLTARGLGINALGLVGYLALARLLSPRDFGVAALGLSVVFFANFVADAGLGAALIRRGDEPVLADYACVVGLQLAIMLVAVLAVGCWLLLTRNTVAAVSLVYASALPVLPFSIPSAIALERHLNFRPIVISDVVQVVAYTTWTVGGALLGGGVFALASGAVVRTLAGTAVLNRLGPIGWLRPTVDFGRLRGLLGFGVKFQLSGAISLARDQGLNLLTVLLLGYPTLGLWTLVLRVMSVPLLVFNSLWRVSFPALSRMLAAGEDVDNLMRRSVGTAGVIGGLVYVPMSIALPRLVPVLVGSKWSGALEVLPYLLLGLLASLPISVVATGFLLAKGDAGAIVRVNLGLSAVNLSVAVACMPVFGYVGLGLGQAAGSVVDGWLLARAVRGAGGPRLFERTLAPAFAGVFAYGAAEAARLLVPDDLAWILAASLAAVVVYGASALATSPTDVRNAIRLILSLKGRLRSRGPDEPGL